MIYISDNLTKFILITLNLLIIIYLLSPLLLKSFLPDKNLIPDIISAVVIIFGLLITFSILEINLSNLRNEVNNIKSKNVKIATIENFENIDNTDNNDKTDTSDNINKIEDTISLPQPKNVSSLNKLRELKKTATEKYVETLCNGRPEEIEKKCKKLTNSNCKLTKCCVLLNNNKCVSGSETGPTFLTDKNNNKIEFDSYIYDSKCYGKCK
jgi:uncharacterized protein YhhL (DUF1145 family)